MKYFALVILFITINFTFANAQFEVFEVESPNNAKINRARGRSMLSDIKEVIKDRYYDKNFGGIDLEQRFKETEKRIDTHSTNADIFSEIANLIMEFDDSHTRFFPPARANRVEYGITLQMIGNQCFIVDVKNESDSAKQGIKEGFEVLSLGTARVVPTRENLWKIEYLLYSLAPKETLALELKDLNGKTVELVINAKFVMQKARIAEDRKRRNKKREDPYKCHVLRNDTLACRLETFSTDERFVDKMMAEALKHDKLILDLRGNGGGLVKTLKRLTSYFFENKIKIGTMVSRTRSTEEFSKPINNHHFKGKLIVLIDSDSASASEVFARTIQLEKRGTIIGDVSSGSVMTSNFISMVNRRGINLSGFGLNVTVADLIMSDGSRLEKIGVQPEFLVGPTARSLSERKDPVLVFAAERSGVEISQEFAASLNFRVKDHVEDDTKETDEGDIEN